MTKLSKTQHLGLQAYREAAEKYGLLDERGEFAGVNIEDWRTVFYERHESKNQNTKKKAFQRARDELIQNGELVCNGEMYKMGEGNELEENYIKQELRNKQ